MNLRFGLELLGNQPILTFSTKNKMSSTKHTKREIVYVDPLHTAKTLVLVYHLRHHHLAFQYPHYHLAYRYQHHHNLVAIVVVAVVAEVVVVVVL